jgi:muramoyltetrapeptide carboxypeptidase
MKGGLTRDADLPTVPAASHRQAERALIDAAERYKRNQSMSPVNPHEPHKKPHALKPGDTIGIVAPASPFDPAEFARGMEQLREMGFELRTAEGISERRGYLAGSDLQRSAQLHRMFLDDSVDAVMCARGGYGTLRLLAQLDYDLIRAHPKVFIGFSDITALHTVFQNRCGLVTFHGPTVTTLGMADAVTLDSFRRTLTTAAPFCLAVEGKRVLRPGMAEGIFTGGNLATLNHLLGTPFASHFGGAILLIEDTHEAPYRIDRMLTQMRMAGSFEGLKGVVAGSFHGCGAAQDIDRVIADCLGDMAIPILSGCGVGHDAPNLTIPLGVGVRLDTQKGEVHFFESALRP